MRLWIVGLALAWVGVAASGGEMSKVAAGLPADLLVEIRHLDGSVEKFSREVADLEIIVAPDASIQYVHLVLVSGSEKDTHAWYNYNQLAGFRYQFASITGKGKVKIKQLGKFNVADISGLQEAIPQVGLNDFK